MPELPDLEVFAKNLRSKILDRKITDVRALSKRVRNRPNATYPKGRKICAVERDGKTLRFELDDGRCFVVHLMLNGYFFVVEAADLESAKYRKFELWLGDLVFGVGDRQGFAVVDFAPEEASAPDALGADFTEAYWLEEAHARPGSSVKALLMDQDVVRGIGNAYSDEILHAAKVAPQNRCGSVPDKALREIYRSVRRVLEKATRAIEKATPEATGGEYREHLEVHRKDRTTTDSGSRIHIEEVGGKKTYWTDDQVLF